MKLLKESFLAALGPIQWSWLLMFIITMIAIPPANGQVSSITVAVDGMSCPFCAFGVEKRLKKVDGAGSVNVDLRTGTATLSAAEGKTIHVDQIPDAIKTAGFTPGKIRIAAIGTIKTDDSDEFLLQVDGSKQILLLVNLKDDMKKRLMTFMKIGMQVKVSGIFHQHRNEMSVSDAGNNRIQVFDKKGQFLRLFGDEGTKLGQLARPMHLDISGNKLYVADYLNDRIQVFSLEGKVLTSIGTSGTGPGQFDAPAGVAVDNQSRIYVADFFNHRVQLLGPNGKFIRQYGKTGTKGVFAGLFNYPTDVVLLQGKTLIVADAYNDRIQVFSEDGTFLRKWGGLLALNISGSAHGWFKVATVVAVGHKGNIFVADFYNHRIQKFTPEGKFLFSFGSKGSSSGQFDRPTDIAIDTDGNVYVVDFGNNRIQKFAPMK